MWGVTVRFSGGRIQHSVPAWLLNAAATYGTIGYVERLVAELQRDPGRYGYDPAARYTAFIQTWDTAWHNTRSLAFGRRRVGEPLVELMPDPYYLGHEGYRQLRDLATRVPAWQVREPLVGWRGSVTGAALPTVEQIPRVALALACRDIPGTDVKLFGVHSTMHHSFEPGQIEGFIAKHNLVGDRWFMPAFADYRYVLDIDGHANAWGFLEKLILGCCVLKVGSTFEQWFYHRLRPWVHYVPVRADLSDLEQIIDWCYANDEQCAWIAGNAAQAAAAMRFEDEVPPSCQALLSVAYMEPPSRAPSRAIDRTQLSVRPLTVAQSLEAQGDLGRALAEYTRLAMAGQGGATTFRRKALLHREAGEFADAMAAMRHVEALDPHDGATMHAHARIASGLGQDHAAAGLLMRAVAIAADGSEGARIDLVAVCLRLDWLDLAVRFATPAAAHARAWWGSLREDALTRRQEYRRNVFEILRQRRSQSSLPGRSLAKLATLLAALGRLRVARTLADQAMSVNPLDPEMASLVVKILQRQQGNAAALALMERSTVARDDLSPLLVLQLASLLQEQGRFAEVLTLLHREPAERSAFAVRNLRAMALLALGRNDKLRQHCAQWMDETADDHPAGLIIAGQPSPCWADEDTGDVTLVWYRDSLATPDRASTAIETWSRLHPHVRARQFDYHSALQFLQAVQGEAAAAAFIRCRHEQDRADLLKYAFLFHEGGVYVDPRERCLAPLGGMLDQFAAADVAAICSEDTLAYVHGFLLGARAGTAVIGRLLAFTLAESEEGETDDLQPGRWSSHSHLTQVIGRHLAATEQPEDVKLVRFGRYRRFTTRDS